MLFTFQRFPCTKVFETSVLLLLFDVIHTPHDYIAFALSILFVSHTQSPSLLSDAKEVIIDALCHDCSRDLCANYFDSRVIIIGRVSHNYGFAFHSHDIICLNGVFIVCNFDQLLDVHILTC